MNMADWSPWTVKAIDESSLAYLIPDANPKTNAGKMSATVVIASEIDDRDGDLVLTDGIDLTDHRRIPNVCLDHQQKLIAGKAMDPMRAYSVRRVGKQLVATTYFHKGTRLGEEAFRLVESGVFPGASLGWPKASMVCEKRINPDNGWEGKLYKRIRPHEYSHVPNPSNSDCIVQVIEKGFGGRKLLPELDGLLRPYVPDRPPVVTSGFATLVHPDGRQEQIQYTSQESAVSDTVTKAYPDDDTVSGGAAADPMQPPTGNEPDPMAGDPAAQDPNAQGGDHKGVVDQAIADMMASIYSQFTQGAIDRDKALEMFEHLLDSHGTVSNLHGDGDDDEAFDLDGDGDVDDLEGDAEGDDDADPEEDAKAKKKAEAKCADVWNTCYSPVMHGTWQWLRRLQHHPGPKVARVQKAAGIIADRMEKLPPVEKALAEGSLVQKAAPPKDPFADIPAEEALMLADKITALRSDLYSVTGNHVN